MSISPSDSLDILVNVHGWRNSAGSGQYQSGGLIDGADALGYIESADPLTGSYSRDDQENIDSFGASVTANWESQNFVLSSITGYEQTEKLILQETDASPNQLIEIDWFSDVSQFSQEIRLTPNSADRLEWITGLYFFDEDLFSKNQFDILRSLRALGVPFNLESPTDGPFLVEQDYDQGTTSFAAFGQFTYNLNRKLSLTVGGRYTYEERTFNLNSAFVEPEFRIPLIDAFRSKIDDNVFSGKIGITYKPSDSYMFYASFSRGFKSGGFNGGALFFPGEATAVEPEFLNSFEVGFKSSFYENRLHFNTTAFYYDYDNLQVFNLRNFGDVPRQVLQNASDARIYGLDAELEAQPVERLWTRLGLGLLNTEYKDFIVGDGTDYSGNELVSAPDVTFNGAVGYSFPLGSLGSITTRMDFNFNDNMFFDSSNTSRIGADSYWLLNARVAFETKNGRYALAFVGKNLTDTVYLTEVFDLSDFGFDQKVMGAPRTFAVELTMRF